MRVFASSSSIAVWIRVPLLFLGTTSLSTALLVAPSSNCAVQCGNVLSSLSGSDLTCDDSLYKSTVQGQTFQSCIACELNSTYVDPQTNQTDLQWLLYNLRYTVSYCLFGFPNNSHVENTPCITTLACADIQNSTMSYLSTESESTYGYCDKWISNHYTQCTKCLGDVGNVDYLMNYITALEAGCRYKPQPGSRLSLQGSLFSSTPVNITDPATMTHFPSARLNNGPFPLTSRIGVAVGVIVGLIISAGCCIVWRGKRRRRAYLARHAPGRLTTSMPRFHDKSGTSPVGSSPQNESAKGLMGSRPWGSVQEDSPISSSGGYFGSQSSGYGMEKTQFSPYMSPVSPEGSATGAGRMREREWPLAPQVRASPTDEIEMSQTTRDGRERMERERWAAQSGLSIDAAPIIRAPMPVKEAPGAGNMF